MCRFVIVGVADITQVHRHVILRALPENGRIHPRELRQADEVVVAGETVVVVDDAAVVALLTLSYDDLD